jgi:hypothetical protein
MQAAVAARVGAGWSLDLVIDSVDQAGRVVLARRGVVLRPSEGVLADGSPSGHARILGRAWAGRHSAGGMA